MNSKAKSQASPARLHALLHAAWQSHYLHHTHEGICRSTLCTNTYVNVRDNTEQSLDVQELVSHLMQCWSACGAVWVTDG